MKKCSECNTITKNKKFCSRKCSAKFNNRKRSQSGYTTKKKTKILICGCGKEFITSIHSESNRTKCLECKRRKCNTCGQYKCIHPYICKRSMLIRNCLHLYFGFNLTKFGTSEVYEEFFRIKDKILDLYSNFSLPEICELIGYKNGDANLSNSLRVFKIPYRNKSTSVKRAIFSGRLKFAEKPSTNLYKQGWHTTWEGKKIFYRSSYELEYAEELDGKRISYEVEKLRIEYWDSQSCTYRIAIPDFYMPDINEIVEIKSTWTYDEQNMKDRFKKFKELGYTCKLILEKKEYDLLV